MEAWDGLEVAYVERGYIEAEMQRSSADDEVREVDDDTPAYLLAVDAPGEPCNLQREWMHSHGPEEFFNEGFPALAVRICFRPVDAVRQLHRGHSR